MSTIIALLFDGCLLPVSSCRLGNGFWGEPCQVNISLHVKKHAYRTTLNWLRFKTEAVGPRGGLPYETDGYARRLA